MISSNDANIITYIISKRERKKTPPWIIWPISQTIHFGKTPPTKLHKMVTCQRRKTVKFYHAAAFSRTPKPDPLEGLPHPVLFRGNDHRFPAATDPSYSATLHPVKSSPSMCADLTSTRKTSKGGEMPRFEEFQQYFLSIPVIENRGVRDLDPCTSESWDSSPILKPSGV